MNDNNIYRIQISKQKDGVEPQEQKQVAFTPKEAKDDAGKPKSAVGDVKASAINLGLIHLGKQAVQYGISNYGNLTGDTIGQQQINAVLEVAGIVAMAAQGPLGMIAAAGVVGFKIADRAIDIEKSKIISRNMQQRTGITFGGSR